MIKNSIYIRKLTARQRKQLEAVQESQKIKTVPKILFFVLDKYHDQKNEIARLNRIVEMKQKKIEKLQNTELWKENI